MFSRDDIENIKMELHTKSPEELDKIAAFATIKACELLVLKKIIEEYREEQADAEED
jgi:hypothetical protein